VRRAWRAWLSWLELRESGTTLAVLRIAVAAIVLGTLASVATADLLGVLWVDAEHGGYRDLSATHPVVRLLGGARPDVMWSLFAIATVGAALLLVGLGGRAAAAVTLAAFHPLVTVNADASGGSDAMITNALWLLVLGTPTATLSVDCRRRHGRWQSDAKVAAWPRHLFVVQLLVVYGATGLHKMSIDWVPGGTHAALWWVFHDPTWCRFDLRGAVVHGYGILQVASAVTWWWEVTAPLWLLAFWLRATVDRGGRLRALVRRVDPRTVFTAIGAGLHVGILLALEVGPFSWISLAFYFALWSPRELEAAAVKIQRASADIVRRGRTSPRSP
jgi:hypothetical protein